MRDEGGFAEWVVFVCATCAISSQWLNCASPFLFFLIISFFPFLHFLRFIFVVLPLVSRLTWHLFLYFLPFLYVNAVLYLSSVKPTRKKFDLGVKISSRRHIFALHLGVLTFLHFLIHTACHLHSVHKKFLSLTRWEETRSHLYDRFRLCYWFVY